MPPKKRQVRKTSTQAVATARSSGILSASGRARGRVHSSVVVVGGCGGRRRHAQEGGTEILQDHPRCQFDKSAVAISRIRLGRGSRSVSVQMKGLLLPVRTAALGCFSRSSQGRVQHAGQHPRQGSGCGVRDSRHRERRCGGAAVVSLRCCLQFNSLGGPGARKRGIPEVSTLF